VAGRQAQVFVPLSTSRPRCERVLATGVLRLNCAPLVNLWEELADRVRLDEQTTRHRIVIDRQFAGRAHEIFDVVEVAVVEPDRSRRRAVPQHQGAYEVAEQIQYGLERRVARSEPAYKTRLGEYRKTDVLLGIAPMPASDSQAEVRVRATNGYWPEELRPQRDGRGFELPLGRREVSAVLSLAGPSTPRESVIAKALFWETINQLSVDYLALSARPEELDAHLRQAYALLAGRSNALPAVEIVGTSQHICRVRGDTPTASTCVRGTVVQLSERAGVAALVGRFEAGAAVACWLGHLAAVGSFVQTELVDKDGRVLHRWLPRCGDQLLNPL